MGKTLHVLLFVLGFAGAAAGLRSLDSFPFWSWVRDKASHWEANLDAYDTLFIGSSHLHCGLIPAVFDARMRELGRPTKAYNMAYSGLRPHDFDQIVRWVVEKRPAKLKHLVIELHTWAPNLELRVFMGSVEVEMHAPRTFFDRCESILLRRYSALDTTTQLLFAGLHTLTHALSIGHGFRIFDDRISRSYGRPPRAGREHPEAGFLAIDDTTLSHVLDAHADFVADPGAYETWLAQKVENIAPPWLAGGFNTRVMREQVARIRAAGIEPIYVVMPTFEWDGFFGRDGVVEAARYVRVLELDLPAANRAVFDRNLWFDSSHLNRAGAEVMSRLMAERIVEAIATPIGEPLSSRPWPLAPPALVGSWADDAEQVVALTATGLPFLGDLLVSLFVPRAEGSGEGELVATVPLSRRGLASAGARVDVRAWYRGGPIDAQLAVAIAGEPVMRVGARIEPRR